MALFISWCSLLPKYSDGEWQFEERHAQEMQNKSDKASQLAGETSATLDLLMPEDEIDIVTQEVNYYEDVNWFYAYPEDNPTAPWIVIIHEWWGLNDHIKDMARVLAMQWYKTLAVDLYKGRIANTAAQARTLSSELVQEDATANLLAAESFLRETAPRVASLWRCLGGKQSLQLSLASDTLDATVIYYGRLETDPTVLASINQPVLGIFAENDGGIPPSAVAAFQSWLDAAGIKNYDLTIYPGVDHAFANPTGDNYTQEATIEAWQKTLWFLDQTLKK